MLYPHRSIFLVPNFLRVAVIMVLISPYPGVSAAPGAARLPSLRLDFGPSGSEVRPGSTLVGNERYEARRGYGWNGQAPELIEFPEPPESGQPHHRSEAKVYAEVEDPLKRDAAISTSDMEFRADLPNGTYDVTLIIGDLRETLGSIDVYINGQLSAEHVAAWAPRHRNLLRNTLGWWNEVRRTVQVTDGKVQIRLTGNETYYRAECERQEGVEPAWAAQFPFSNNVNIYARVGLREAPYIYAGFPFLRNALMGLEIVPHRPAPIESIGDQLSLTQPTSSPALKHAIEAFNAHKFNEAVTELTKVTEDDAQTAKAILQLWLVGRLELDDFTGLLECALATLRPYVAANPDENGVAAILEDAEFFAKGMHIHDNRGHITFGEGHFGQNSRAIGYWWLIPPDSPVYYRARLFIGRAAHMLVPYLPTRGTERDIFEKLQLIFPHNRFVRYQLTQEWEPHGDGSDYYDWVWNDYSPAVKGAPAWVASLYPAFQHYVDWCEWWFNFRMDENGSLGGGWGDDVEIIGAMAYTAYTSPDISKLLNEGTRKFMDGLWNYSEIDPELGFYAPLWDAEHSAEWTGNTLGMAVQIDYGSPVWIERAMKTGQLMRDVWTDYDTKGLRRFRANYFGAATVGLLRGHQYDSWINYRAIRPASAVLWYNQNQAIAELMIEHADAWLDAAMSTERGKPRGVIPHNIGFPNAIIGGHDTDTWYGLPPNGDGITNRQWADQGYKTYIYDLLTTAYDLTGSVKYLEPLRLEYELAAKYGNVPASGSGARLQTIRGERSAVPTGPNRPTPAANLVPGSEEWVAMNLKGVNAWILAKRKIDGRQGALQNDITVEDVIRYSDHMRTDLRRVYPLVTTEAGPTDRLAISGGINPLLIYTGGRVGGPMIECAVTYRNTTRQFAAAVLGTDSQGFRLLYYSLAPDELTINLVPWHLEAGGNYILRYGPDEDGDQKADRIIEERTFEFPQRGTEIPLTVKPRVNYVIEVDQVQRGGLPELAPDPGIERTDIRFSPYAGQILARIHNVGSEKVRNLEVAAYDGDPDRGGTLIGKGTIPNLEAPVDLSPRSTTIGFEWRPSHTAHEIYIVIDPDRKLIEEITTFNNRAHTMIEKPGDISLSRRE